MEEIPLRDVGKLGRPTAAQVRDECAAISRLLSRGCGELEIRGRLGLSRNAFRARLRYLRRTAIDPHWVWAKFLAAQNAAIGEIAEIGDRALAADRPAFGVAIDAVVAQARIRRETLMLGLAMGIYAVPRQSQDPPTLGWFLGPDDDSKLPSGNVFDAQGRVMGGETPESKTTDTK